MLGDDSGTRSGVRVRVDALRDAQGVRARLQLEGLRRQLPRGVPHPRRAPDAEQGDRLRQLPRRTAAVQLDPARAAQAGRVRAVRASTIRRSPRCPRRSMAGCSRTSCSTSTSGRCRRTSSCRSRTTRRSSSSSGSRRTRRRIRRRIRRGRAWSKFSDEIQDEDVEICERVQRNLRSRVYDRGRYSAKRENGVHHFHSLLHEFLT